MSPGPLRKPGRFLTPLLLGPVVILLDRLGYAGEQTLFVLAAAALVPLSWLIGEATDNLALHTGPVVGGFLNATFGIAPELIIAIVAISDGLTEVVRASLVGSIVGNLLLVLGFALLFGRTGGHIDRRSAYVRSAWSASPPFSCSSRRWPASTAIRSAARSRRSPFRSR